MYEVGEITKLTLYEPLPDGFMYPNGKVCTNNIPKRINSDVVLFASGPSFYNKKVEYNTDVACVNGAGVLYKYSMNYWFSLHPQHFALRTNSRKKNNYPTNDIVYISNKLVRNPPVCFMQSNWYGGSSSLYALDCLVSMGYTNIHLIGIDLSGNYEAFRVWWEDYQLKTDVNVTADTSSWALDWCKRKSM